MFIFNLNVVFTMNFLKMSPNQSTGFLSGAGFHGDEFARAWF
jgi:hypothetical protein